MASLNDLKSQYYISLGYSGSVAYMERQWLLAQLGLPPSSNLSVSDMNYAYYKSKVGG